MLIQEVIEIRHNVDKIIKKLKQEASKHSG